VAVAGAIVQTLKSRAPAYRGISRQQSHWQFRWHRSRHRDWCPKPAESGARADGHAGHGVGRADGHPANRQCVEVHAAFWEPCPDPAPPSSIRPRLRAPTPLKLRFSVSCHLSPRPIPMESAQPIASLPLIPVPKCKRFISISVKYC
jgi:hypothetical protein